MARSSSSCCCWARAGSAWSDTKAPESLVDSDQPGPSSPRWMPCTRDKDNSFTTSLDGMILHGTFSHGQLSGSMVGQGLTMAFGGTRSPKRFHLVRPLDRTQTLAQANAHQAAHEAKQAIAMYQKLIEDDRFDTTISGQALVGLVDSLQSPPCRCRDGQGGAGAAGALRERPAAARRRAHADPRRRRGGAAVEAVAAVSGSSGGSADRLQHRERRAQAAVAEGRVLRLHLHHRGRAGAGSPALRSGCPATPTLAAASSATDHRHARRRQHAAPFPDPTAYAEGETSIQLQLVFEDQSLRRPPASPRSLGR